MKIILRAPLAVMLFVLWLDLGRRAGISFSTINWKAFGFSFFGWVAIHGLFVGRSK